MKELKISSEESMVLTPLTPGDTFIVAITERNEKQVITLQKCLEENETSRVLFNGCALVPKIATIDSLEIKEGYVKLRITTN